MYVSSTADLSFKNLWFNNGCVLHIYIYIRQPLPTAGGARQRTGTRGARGKRKGCHGVLALRAGPLTGAVQDESQLQEGASKLEARNTVPWPGLREKKASC